jgi:hypothetical protein
MAGPELHCAPALKTEPEIYKMQAIWNSQSGALYQISWFIFNSPSNSIFQEFVNF